VCGWGLRAGRQGGKGWHSPPASAFTPSSVHPAVPTIFPPYRFRTRLDSCHVAPSSMLTREFPPPSPPSQLPSHGMEGPFLSPTRQPPTLDPWLAQSPILPGCSVNSVRFGGNAFLIREETVITTATVKPLGP
jgi:hypothetical protein